MAVPFASTCIRMSWLEEGVAIEKLVLIPVWREGGRLFDETERAALA
jgi:hypothetical protein